ncbi:class I SAM-dependent methyltransferase [Halalkalibacter akibai]|uniref:Ribosomal RNA small subunit methyltransferase C n=1 Tax=Halalkalibacter akibai (strain ATCC 43226 / DSM 21942 / CIP 109018 / JCM 9157 / 1139) TaxID=1236973 RepID=W4QVF1_HALA3|nr:class I SAM-dependent methyltransferase [Halalkalibacter akibai]GAE35319.1 ribosomal RNA small subunit methyltransferase C [Halalkalibacter akibai JCM 9157]
MSDHYYTENPNVDSQERDWSFVLRGNKLSFYSDRGVFSKKEVDFGSKLLTDVFSFPEVRGDILDVGCGYGPIGLSIAKTDLDRTVHMIDVNERALSLSQKNADRNQITNVQIYKSDRLENVDTKGFAAIVTNPPIRAGKQIVHSIFEQAQQHLTSGGELWVVIQKKQGAPSAVEKLETLFQEVEVLEKKKGYYIIRAKKI